MRAGQVVRVRVNPKDCMAALDILQKAGINTQGMSFSAAVSLAMSSAFETFRQRGVIPDRDGFEYGEMMQPYLKASQASKLAFSNAIHMQGSEFTIAPVQFQQPNVSEVTHNSHQQKPERRRVENRWKELCAKKDLADVPGSGVLWSAQDQQEFDQLYQVMFED